MNKFFIYVVIFVCMFCVSCGDKKEKNDSLLKKGTKSVVSGLISSGKNAISGVKEGVDEGRKSGDSLDGAVVVSNKEDMLKHLSVSVIALEKDGDGKYIVTLAIKNNNSSVVRLTNLHELKSVILLDKEGFVTTLPKISEQGVDVTVIGDTAVRKRYVFEKVEEAPLSIRIYGYDIALPDAVTVKKEEGSSEKIKS